MTDDLAALRETGAAVIAGWDDVATVEPCRDCSRDGVALWSHDDDRRMDALIDRLRAALASHVTAQGFTEAEDEADRAAVDAARADTTPSVSLEQVTAQVGQRDAEAKNATHTESVDGQGNYRAWTEHVCGTVEKPGWVSLHEYDLTRAERDAALARVDTARRNALTEAADAAHREGGWTVMGVEAWLRARAKCGDGSVCHVQPCICPRRTRGRRAAVESPDQPEDGWARAAAETPADVEAQLVRDHQPGGIDHRPDHDMGI